MCNHTYEEELVQFTREFSETPCVLKVWIASTNLQVCDFMLISMFCILYDQGK